MSQNRLLRFIAQQAFLITCIIPRYAKIVNLNLSFSLFDGSNNLLQILAIFI